MKKLRFGIIATGGIAGKFARTAPLVDEIVLEAVASRAQEKANVFAQQYNIPKAYGSYEQLFADPDIDAVYIATPHNFHMQNCIDAARAGKHILCEKPMGLNRADNEAVFAEAKKNGVFVMEAMWTRFLPCMVKAREWVQDGKVGDVRFISALFGHDRPFDPQSRLYAPELAGGALYDLGVYNIEYILDFTKGKKIKESKSFYVNNEIGTDMAASMLLLFDDGAQAQLFCAFDCATNHASRVYGKQGQIVFDSFFMPKRVELYVDGKLSDSFESSFESGFEYEIRHMADCIAQGLLNSPIMPPEDTLACADLFEQAFGK